AGHRPRHPLLPYTTLCRSQPSQARRSRRRVRGSALDSPPTPKNLTTDVPEGLLQVFKLLLRSTLLPCPSEILDRVTAVEVQVLSDVDDLCTVGPAIGVVRGVKIGRASCRERV